MRKVVNIFSLLVAAAVLVLAALMFAGVVKVASRSRILILVALALVIIVMTVFSMKKQ